MPAINIKMASTLNEEAGLSWGDAAFLGCINIFPLAEAGSREGCAISRNMTSSTVLTTVSVLFEAVNDRRVVVMGGNAGPTTSTRGVGVGRGLLCLVRGQTHRGGMAACRACFAPTRRLISCTSRLRGRKRVTGTFFSNSHEHNNLVDSTLTPLLHRLCESRLGWILVRTARRPRNLPFPMDAPWIPIPKRVSSHDGDEFDPVSSPCRISPG